MEYFSGGDSIEKKVIAEFIVIISTNLAGRGTDIKLDQAIIDRGNKQVRALTDSQFNWHL